MDDESSEIILNHPQAGHHPHSIIVKEVKIIIIDADINHNAIF